MNQTLRVWLISSCPCGTKPARRRKRPPGRARSPAMSQPGGQWQFGVDERGKGCLNFVARVARSRRRSRGAKRWKLASYEVAGNAPGKFVRPERTMDSAVLSGRISFCDVNQTLRVWLISGCPFGTKPARRRKRPPGWARSPAMSQPGGQWQFGEDERGQGAVEFLATDGHGWNTDFSKPVRAGIFVASPDTNE